MSFGHPIRRRSRLLLPSFHTVLAVTVLAAACTPSTVSQSTSVSPTPNVSLSPPSPDPRIGLRGGAYDAAEAVWNLNVLSKTKPSEKFLGGINSDLAFSGNYVFQGASVATRSGTSPIRASRR